MADIVEVVLRLQQVRQFVSGADSASKAVKGVGDSAEKTSKKTTAGWKSLAKWTAGAAAIAGATRFMHGAVDAASNLNEEVSKTQVVFGAAGPAVVKWSQSSADALGMAQQEALAATGTFGNMLVPMGFARQRASQMSRSMVSLAGDMASFNNAAPQETLDALRAGLAGETEPLRRFGVFLNQARIQAQAMAMGLVKGAIDTVKLKKAQFDVAMSTARARKELKKHGAQSLEYRKAAMAVDLAESKLAATLKGRVPQLTAAQKAQATYALIMKDTRDTQGDIGRTSGSLANQQRILRARYTNISATLGAQLLPAVVQVVSALSKFLNLLAPLMKNTTLFRVVLGTFVVLLIAYKIAMIASTIATMSLNGSLLITIGIIAAVIIIAAALAVGFYLLYRRVGWFHAAVDATWRAVKIAFARMVDAFKVAWGWIKANWPLLLGILTGPFGLAAVAIIKNFDKVKKAVMAVVNAIKRALKNIPGAGVLGKVTGAAGSVMGAVGLQHGGTVTRRGAAIVGERGPEMLSLPVGARVTPLEGERLAPAGWSGDIVIPVYLDGREVARSVARVTADKLARR